MSNDDKILLMLENIQADVGTIKADVAHLKVDVAGLKADVEELKTDVAELKQGQAQIERRVTAIEQDVVEIRTTLQEHKQKMVLLHELVNSDYELLQSVNRKLDEQIVTNSIHKENFIRIREAITA